METPDEFTNWSLAKIGKKIFLFQESVLSIVLFHPIYFLT